MTQLQKGYLEAAEEFLAEHAELEGDGLKAVRKIIQDWKRAVGRLDCARKVVAESVPRLEEAFRRYGCDKESCKAGKCPKPWPCQANLIRVVEDDIRECLGSGEGDTFKEWDTVFWNDPDEGISSGDYTVTDVSGDILTLEADDGSEVEAYASECRHREWYDVAFPNWALCYFVNGDGSSLTDEEMKQVDAFVGSMRADGYTLDTVTGDTNEFCAHPAFGLASDTTRVRFYKPMKGPTDA